MFIIKRFVFLRTFLCDDDAALPPLPFREGLDIFEFRCDLMYDTAIGSVEVGDVTVAGLTNLLNPFPRLSGNLVGALLLVIGDIDIDPHQGGVLVTERGRDDVLQTAKRLGVTSY